MSEESIVTLDSRDLSDEKEKKCSEIKIKIKIKEDVE